MRMLIMIFLLMLPMLVRADANDEMKIQILNSQIESLTLERDEKYTKLKQCESKTTGFKIAGITTLVATGVGIYGNIKLAQRLRDGDRVGIFGKSVAVVDPRPQEEKNEGSRNVMCESDPETAAAHGIQC